MKKLSVFVLICVCLSVFCGCQKKDASADDLNDPITDYDSVENVRVEGTGGPFTVKQKIFPYKNGGVAVLHVDNRTGSDCSVEITGRCKSLGGDVVKTERKQFRGFSKDDCNYFLFLCENAFDSFSYEISLLDDDTPGRSAYYSFGTDAWAEPQGNYLQQGLPVPEDFYFKIGVSSHMTCTAPERMFIDLSILTFDNTGSVENFDQYSGDLMTGDLQRFSSATSITEGEKYVLPDNMTGTLKRIVEIVRIQTVSEYARENSY